MDQCVEDAQNYLSNNAFWRSPESTVDFYSNPTSTLPEKKKKKKISPKSSPKRSRSPVKKTTAKTTTKKAVEKKKAAGKKVKAAAVKVARDIPAAGGLKTVAVPSAAVNLSTADSEAIKRDLIKSFMPSSGAVKGVDVVFSFDTTGSMCSYLNEVKTCLSQMVKQLLTDVPTIRIGIMCHGDYCDSYVTKFTDLSKDVDALVKFITNVGSTGGGDEPEAYEVALRECSEKMSWEADHAKALVMIGDAYPHEPNFAANKLKIDWKVEVANLAAKNVKIYSVRCGSHANTTSINFFKTMADVTSGSYLELKHLSLLKDMFMGVCYREGYEMELASNASRYEGVAQDVEKEIEALGVEGGAARLLRPDDGAEKIAISNEDMLKIHEAIHDYNKASATLGGKTYTIAWGSAGNRYVRIDELGLLFMQQNIERSNKYAQMAREGKKITWLCKEGKWGVIVDGSIDKKLD